MVTNLPPTSEVRVLIIALPQERKMVAAWCWSAVYKTEPRPTVCSGFLCPSKLPVITNNVLDVT